PRNVNLSSKLASPTWKLKAVSGRLKNSLRRRRRNSLKRRRKRGHMPKENSTGIQEVNDRKYVTREVEEAERSCAMVEALIEGLLNREVADLGHGAVDSVLEPGVSWDQAVGHSRRKSSSL
ncbi:hypothetical protein FRC01_010886, partial [Tulasnella sp. 417]